MAKSLRSKRRRKMRAVKRVRYGEKELERLKKTLAADDDNKKDIDEVMAEVSDVVTITDKKTIIEKAKKQDDAETVEEMDDGRIKHNYSLKTMKDQFGSYPNWMNQRKTNRRKKTRKGRPKRK